MKYPYGHRTAVAHTVTRGGLTPRTADRRGVAASASGSGGRAPRVLQASPAAAARRPPPAVVGGAAARAARDSRLEGRIPGPGCGGRRAGGEGRARAGAGCQAPTQAEGLG
eukprot:CAMPEP_0206011402 /NCGR_PEP_ID=MMETSP1464-20131121/13173_1 /ASSEMBLY_ACC=CAM_ASM_001124 /TAXON_ID=119497 /ORGANISM="Exanthemachrysis gayraliae, Strain RCC1523" /LENGTH=110 /DNA_ID=CAMNT_0053385065 /DNA_START=33 /DNA_END=362 /DNA_ORIENTATION=+